MNILPRKARISTVYCFSFMTAHAPTKTEADSQIQSTGRFIIEPSHYSPSRDTVFVLTDANVRTGKRENICGEIKIKGLGVYNRDVLNKNYKLLLPIAEGSKLARMNMFFLPPKRGVSFLFHSANRGRGQARLHPDKTGGPSALLMSHCLY